MECRRYRPVRICRKRLLPGSHRHRCRYSQLADGDSSITQTIATIPGQHYELSFWLDDTAGSSNDFTVSWNGATELSLTNAPTFGYREYMYDVVATSDSTALTFAGANDIGYWALDDVLVQTAPQGATTAPQTITPTSVIVAPASGNENQSIDLSQAIAITTNYLYTDHGSRRHEQQRLRLRHQRCRAGALGITMTITTTVCGTVFSTTRARASTPTSPIQTLRMGPFYNSTAR
jgi:hypothetical protein